MEQEIFARHTAHADKLISFGFIKKGKDFFYQEAFHRGAFRAEITVRPDSGVTGRVIDTRTSKSDSAVAEIWGTGTDVQIIASAPASPTIRL